MNKDNTNTAENLDNQPEVESDTTDQVDEDAATPSMDSGGAAEDAEPAEDGTEPADAPPPQGDELDRALAEAEKNRQGWQRTLAEFQNYKRRIEREQQMVQQRAAHDVLTKLLPIIDDFERAMSSLPEDLADNAWLSGITLIQGKFRKLLEDHEVEAIDPTGDPFDPTLHQAIARDDSDEVESGHIIETLQKGYRSGSIILRAALVRVAN